MRFPLRAETAGVLLSMLLAGAGACARNPSPRGPDPSCAGSQLLIVDNDWTQLVDLLADVPGHATPVALGSVAAGDRVEIPLPPGTRKAWPARALETDPLTLPRIARQKISMRYICRDREPSGSATSVLPPTRLR